MATALTPVTKIGPYPALPVAANSLDLAWTTGDASGNTIAVSGATRYLVLMRNTDAGAHTVTISSVVDTPYNRTGDITDYSIGAGETAGFYFSSTDGWVDTETGKITITPETTDIEFMVFTF